MEHHNSEKQDDPSPLPDFNNTEIAFSNKTNAELKKSERLFKLMSNPSLVKVGSTLGMFAVKYKLPFSEYFVKKNNIRAILWW